MPALQDELLDPISGESPGGIALRYDPVYDKIKEARREGEDAWGGEPKKADWNLVVKLAKEALAKRSKDLQIAAWLTEALVRRQGYAGMRDGFALLDAMLDRYWDTLYPEIEDGDLELRAAPLQWVGLKLDLAVRMVPVNAAGHDLLRYESSRMIPTEGDAAGDDNKREQRELAISEGKVLPEEFDRSFDSTPADFYRKLYADLHSAVDAVAALDARSRERFGENDAPSYSGVQNALESARMTIRQLLLKKDPHALDEASSDDTSADGMQDGDVGVAIPTGAAVPSTTSFGVASRAIAEPSSRDDAAALVERAARYLRKTEPLNPASYLMLRGFRWGELRAGGREVDPRLLEAPTTQVRTRLKGLLLDQNWRELIEAGEGVMSTPQGRGWLDLQRYILTACDALAGEYDVVANAIRAELRGLLDELPKLVNMTLMDDTPTANAETREWLRANVLTAVAGDLAETPQENGDAPQRRVGDARALALSEARAGRPERAIELLMRELAQEKTKRGRFLTQTQLASIMIDAGHDVVAMPILEELIALVEGHRLEEWEAGDVVARPMSLLYRVLGQTGGDEGTRQQLYLRICRLDPLQAIGFAHQSASGE